MLTFPDSEIYDSSDYLSDFNKFINQEKLDEHSIFSISSSPLLSFSPANSNSSRSLPDLTYSDSDNETGNSVSRGNSSSPVLTRGWPEFYSTVAHVVNPIVKPSYSPNVINPSSLQSSSFSDEGSSDRDADGESDGDDDDEYIPSRELIDRKRRRCSGIRVRRKVTSPSLSSKTSTTDSPYPATKRPRLAPPSRNRQASASTYAVIEKAAVNVSAETTNYVCPECGWKQANRRLPDFKRHLKTHTRPSSEDETKGWWCKGLLHEKFLQLPCQEQMRIRDVQGETYTFLGRLRIGGCRMTFSRRDALKRHLDNDSKPCVGRPCGPLED